MPKQRASSAHSNFYRTIGTRGWRGSDYFTFSVSSPMLRRWIAAQIPNKKAMVLSIGCGTGELESHLRQLHHRVIGLDLSHPMLKRAARNGLDMAVAASAERLPFGSACFDVLMILEAIGHLDMKAAFGEARRVLKKRGRLLITTYTSRQEVQKHYRKFDFEEIAAALTEAEFRVEEQSYLETKRNKVKAVSSEDLSTLLYTAATRKP